MSTVVKELEDKHLMFFCPACECGHMIRHGENGSGWQWNKDINKPTFTPSIFVNKDRNNPNTPACHSFVTDGNIQYLSDCSHKMAGQTVPLPTWDFNYD